MILRILLTLQLMAIPFIALADQQAYIQKHDAERALAIVNSAQAVRLFCAPCEDRVSVLRNVTSAEIREVGPVAGFNDPKTGAPIPFWELYIDEQPIDLAYTYVPVTMGFWFWRKDKWQNLARLLSLPVTGVDEFLSEVQVGASSVSK